MNTRPKIKIELNSVDKIMELLGFIMFILLWVITLSLYSKFPERIPTHFNFSGQPDDYGNKVVVLILPIIGSFIFVGLTLINRFPHIFNYPAKITDENAQRQYTFATRLIRYMKLAILVIFTIIVIMISNSINGHTSGLEYLILPSFMLIIFGPMGYFIVQMVREGKQTKNKSK